MKTCTAVLSFVAALAACTSAHAANIILNGNFSANASAYGADPGYDNSGTHPSSNPSAPTSWNIVSSPSP
jgi:hypothetical protein